MIAHVRTWADRLIGLSATIGALGLLVEVAVILTDVIGRALGDPLYGSQDMITMTMVILVFGGKNINVTIKPCRVAGLEYIDSDVAAVAITHCNAAKHQNDHGHRDHVVTTIKWVAESTSCHVRQNNGNLDQQAKGTNCGGQADQPVRP